MNAPARTDAPSLKNTLTVVLSTARQAISAHPAPEEFVDRFDGRIRALSDAHRLLDESRWEGVDLGAAEPAEALRETAPARL